MTYFKENVRYLRKKNQISQNQLANDLGYKSFTTIQKWEDGSATPSYKTLDKLAKYFNVDVNSLVNDNLEENNNSEVPILGIVRGGSPIEAIENILGYEHVFPDDAKHKDCFYLQVVGDSMRDERILPGDLLYVHFQQYLDNGDIGVVLVNNEATVKRVYFKDDKMILQPANENYQPLVFDLKKQDDNIQIIGKVLHNRIKF